jgi:hypothetical protein
MRDVLVVSCLALSVFLAMATSGDDKENKKEQKKVESTEATFEGSAEALFRAYDENEIEADIQYKGKVLEISGKIDSIGKDIMDEPYVTLRVGRTFGSVQCMFSKSSSQQLVRLRKGQAVVLKGRCAGKMVNVILRGCVVSKQ